MIQAVTQEPWADLDDRRDWVPRENRSGRPKPAIPRARRAWEQVLEYVISLMTIAVVTFVLWLFRGSLTQADVSLFNLLAILALAIRLRAGPVFLAAIISFFSSNFFFIEPLYTFIVTRSQFIDLCIYLIAALLVTQMGAYSRHQGEIARLRAGEQELLHSFSSTFNQIPDRDGVYETLERVIHDRLGAPRVSILPGGHVPPVAESARVTSSLLLSTSEEIFGTVQVMYDVVPSPEQSRLLQACVEQASAALQRIELTGRVERSLGFEQADRLKTALLHAVSHDLRTPITIIKTSADNLRGLGHHLSEEERQETLEGIESAADHLDTMVGNLLDLSRLEAGAMPINQEWNALPDITGDVAARMWELYHDERIRLLFPADMPPVRCDFGLMLQALGNVVENALRYEPTGSMVDVRGSHFRSEVRIAVVGHGLKIPPGQRERIMEPFNRQENGHPGLGLAISKGIVEAHRGRIWVEDTPGGGATFVIALPRDLVEEQADADPDSR
jgi:two-component system, OmpR family, sensor histidine kinase KdpD